MAIAKPCCICGEPARVQTPTEPGVCSPHCFYTLEAEVERPIAGEILTGDSLEDVLLAESIRAKDSRE